MKNNRGFTLIELMITISILATLTVFTAQAIGQAIKAKTKLQGQIDEVSRMRDAMRLLEKDINLGFHYTDLEKELNSLVNKGDPATPQNPSDPSGFVPPPPATIRAQNPEDVREVPRRNPETHFIGTGEVVNFVTLNGGRNVRNSRQADFIEVGYSLKECRGLQTESTSKCLWRRSSPSVDLDVTKGGDEVVLLENVSEFKLRYIGKGKQDWNQDWRTDEQGDGATKGKFPQAVEVSLTVEKPSTNGTKKKYSMQAIVPIHFPNNSHPEEKPNASQNQFAPPSE